MSQPRAKAAKAPKMAVVRPEFNQAEHVVNSLTRQNMEQARKIAVLEAAVAERDAFIQANAELLELTVQETGQPVEHSHPGE